MTVEYKMALKEIGVTVDNAVERFLGNEELYNKFLYKFIEDENYKRLVDSYEKTDLEAAFHAAHTLKGVSANLGFANVNKVLDPFVEKLRNQTVDSETDILMESVKMEMDKVISVIQRDKNS